MAVIEETPQDVETQKAINNIIQIFTELSHPVRVRALLYIREHKQASPVQMAGPLGVSLGTIAYHIRVLEGKMGMIELKSETRVRGAVEHTYRLTTKGRRILKIVDKATQ